MTYLNIKSHYGVETVDQLDKKDFSSFKAFRIELNRLINEYHLSGMNVYKSTRCDKTWNK